MRLHRNSVPAITGIFLKKETRLRRTQREVHMKTKGKTAVYKPERGLEETDPVDTSDFQPPEM